MGRRSSTERFGPGFRLSHGVVLESCSSSGIGALVSVIASDRVQLAQFQFVRDGWTLYCIQHIYRLYVLHVLSDNKAGQCTSTFIVICYVALSYYIMLPFIGFSLLCYPILYIVGYKFALCVIYYVYLVCIFHPMLY